MALSSWFFTHYYLPATDEALQHDQLAYRFPEVSIPAPALGVLEPSSLDALGLVPLAVPEAPAAVFGSTAQLGPVEQRADGSYGRSWTLQPWTPEEVADAMERRRRDARDEIERIARELGDTGLAWDFGGADGVLHLQLRGVDDKANWLTLRGEANEAIAEGQGDKLLPIRTRENLIMVRPASYVRQVMQGVSNFGFASLARTWALKDLVRDAQTPEQLDAIDMAAGWPA